MVQGRAYSVITDSFAVTAAKDILEIVAPADAVVSVSRIQVTQATQTASEALQVQVHRSAASGTGTAATANPLEVGDPAFGGSCEFNHTVDTTPGVILSFEGWNVLTPYILHFTPEEEIVISPSGVLVVRLDTSPGASMNMSVVAWFREIGG